MRQSVVMFLVLGVCLVLGHGCAAGASNDEDAAGGIVASSEALSVQAAPTTGACIDCKCKYEHAGQDDGCDVYDCVCDTEAKAKCVVNGGPKKTISAPSGLVSQPGIGTTPVNTVGAIQSRPAIARR